MSRAEWLRTFVAVYRSGSVTMGARSRGLSQPAASQHLAALSRAMGGPVLSRTPQGVTPTQRGRELYGRIAEPLDQLEDVLAGLDGGRPPVGDRPLRIGAAAELFDAYLLPRLATAVATPLIATFGSDAFLIDALLSGETDLIVTSAPPPRRTALESTLIGHRTFVLVASAANAPAVLADTVGELRSQLSDAPWVTYSHELPITRKFWSAVLGCPFDADVRLTAPDLRVVAAAVERGVGFSLLPSYTCRQALDEGRLVRLYDVSGLVPADPWFATTRRSDSARPELADAIRLLRDQSSSAHGMSQE